MIYQAAEALFKGKEYEEAANLYLQTDKFKEKALKCYSKAKLFEELVITLFNIWEYVQDWF